MSSGELLAHWQEEELRRKESLGEALMAIPLAERDRWKSCVKAEKQRIYIALSYFGATMKEAACLLGMAEQSLRNWWDREPERMRQLMSEGFHATALKDMPRNLKTLMNLRDLSANQETKRKAALNLLAAAGVHLENPGPSGPGLTVTMTGQNNQLNLLSIDERLDKLVKELGPECRKLLEEERRDEPPGGVSGPPLPSPQAPSGGPP